MLIYSVFAKIERSNIFDNLYNAFATDLVTKMQYFATGIRGSSCFGVSWNEGAAHTGRSRLATWEDARANLAGRPACVD